MRNKAWERIPPPTHTYVSVSFSLYKVKVKEGKRSCSVLKSVPRKRTFFLSFSFFLSFTSPSAYPVTVCVPRLHPVKISISSPSQASEIIESVFSSSSVSNQQLVVRLEALLRQREIEVRAELIQKSIFSPMMHIYMRINCSMDWEYVNFYFSYRIRFIHSFISPVMKVLCQSVLCLSILDKRRKERRNF